MSKMRKNIRQWFIQYRDGTMFQASYNRKQDKLKLFVVFLEALNSIIKYTNVKIKEGTLLVEDLCSQILHDIIPGCSNSLLKEVGGDQESMPSDQEVLPMIHLSFIYIKAV